MKTQSPNYKPEFNCYTTDLVDGFPTGPVPADGTIMRVFTPDTRKLTSIYEVVNGLWHKF